MDYHRDVSYRRSGGSIKCPVYEESEYRPVTMNVSRRTVLGTIATVGVTGRVLGSTTADQEGTNQRVGFPLEFAWSVDIDGMEQRIGSRTDDAVLVAVSREFFENQITAFNLTTGKEEWTIDVSSTVGLPIYDRDDGYVFISEGDTVVAYDLDSRDQVWQTQLRYDNTFYIIRLLKDYL